MTVHQALLGLALFVLSFTVLATLYMGVQAMMVRDF